MALKSLHPAKDSARQNSASDVKSALTLERIPDTSSGDDYKVLLADDQLLGWLCWSPTQRAYFAVPYAMPIDYSTYYRCVAEGLAYFEEQLS